MSPKSLLRHPQCISDFSEFASGTRFQEVLDDAAAKPKKTSLLLMCSGKVYFDLLAHREETGRDDVAIVRVEQLYPYPQKQIDQIFKKFKGSKIKWVQEEPLNMGAWQFLLSFWRNPEIEVVARRVSASPATGYKKVHDMQQAEIVKEAYSS